MPNKVRPAQGDTITLLFEIDGVPVTDVTTANRVRDASMIVPRGDVGLSGPINPGQTITAIFVHDGRLYRWPMRIEEVLPSSYFLVSVREPGEGERREFVRADVEAVVRIRRGPVEVFADRTRVDVSASGVRLVQRLDLVVGEVVDVALQPSQGAAIVGRVEVVRADDVGTACEFVELSTQAENRLIDLVFAARSAGLNARIGMDLG